MNVKPELCYYDYQVMASNSKYHYKYIRNRTISSIPHTHNFYEICYVIRGNCTEIHNGKVRRINENQFTIIVPNQRHYFTNQSDNILIVGLSIEKNEFERMARVIASDITDYIYSMPDEQIFDAFGTVTANLYNNPYLNEQNDIDYKHLLSFFIVNIAKNKFLSQSAMPTKFESMLSRLPSGEIITEGVPALVRLSHYSRTQLTRLMKEHLDKTPWEYVTDLRMSYAYNRLTLTDMKIEDLAEKCGFSSFSHFSQVFKKKFNDTPSAVRKKHINNTI